MPKIIGSLPFDRWENEVLKKLKAQAPDDWIIMPSVKWTLSKNGYVRDGEADFVILVPNSGLIVLEVKGSRQFKVEQDGIWYRKDAAGWLKLKEAPAEQATRNMHDLTEVIAEAQNWRGFPGRFAYIVVYPQGTAESLPPMFDESTLATYRNINNLDTKIRHALERRAGSHAGENFTRSVMDAIIDQLKNRKFRVNKIDTVEDVTTDLSQIDQLTRQQFSSLKGLFDLQRVGVIGPAGSGKTVLALWRLKALVEEGKNAIYVCYNRNLAESLKRQNPEHEDFIWTVDKLFLRIYDSRDGRIGQDEFHREILPGYVMDRANSIKKYEAIIVDEGQDLSEYQTIALFDLLTEDGIWAFFADWNQDLYKSTTSSVIGAEVVFQLYHNCRNAIKINDACNSYVNTNIESMPGMPLGIPPLVEVTKNQSNRALELARQWSADGAIVVLSPYKYENSSMNNVEKGHGFIVSQDINDLGKKDVVVFSTIKSFKGIEAAVIIVVDTAIPDQTKAFSKEDLYVASTRATTRLAFLTSSEPTANYYKRLAV